MKELQHWTTHPHWYKTVLCNLVVNASRVVMRGMNRVNFVNPEEWNRLTKTRNKGLLSFSNHVSLFDDPLLISNLGTTAYAQVRWIAADQKNFFSTALKGFIFSAGKCVPIVRGGGLDQAGFDFLLERLGQNDWVHIFPEGGRTREDAGQLKTPFKLGIGRLLAEARPIAIPFYHYGMHEIMPVGSTLPRMGKQVRVQFGAATEMSDQWYDSNYPDLEGVALWKGLRDWSYETLVELELKTRPNSND
jgi:monolysocardiolipin acyltransferase